MVAYCLRLVVLFFPSAWAAERAFPGYAARFGGITTIAAPRTPLLEASNAAIAQMAGGFTASAWLRFDSLDVNYRLYWIAMSTTSDTAWFTPFAGPHNGYIAQAVPAPSVSTLGEGAFEWHHYTASIDLQTGQVVTYIDGEMVATQTFGAARAVDFFAAAPTLQFGARCTSTSLMGQLGYATCDITADGQTSFVGEMDAVAIYNTVLSPSDVALRWNRSLAVRLRAGLEPHLAIYYDFEGVVEEAGGACPNNAVCADVPVCPNLGSAGSSYDLLLGRLGLPGVLGSAARFRTGEAVALRSPTIVPFVPSGAALAARATLFDPAAPHVVVLNSSTHLTPASASGLEVELSDGSSGTATLPPTATLRDGTNATAPTSIGNVTAPTLVYSLATDDTHPTVLVTVHVLQLVGPRSPAELAVLLSPLPDVTQGTMTQLFHRPAAVIEDGAVAYQVRHTC
jgi:hypothetical protein